MTRFFPFPDWVEPELLTHPTIPDPLHRVNPRSIMGKTWWDKVRKASYAEHEFHCHACGVHKSRAKGNLKRLECHERYEIDYAQGRVYFQGVVALCPWCHQFIHSGRLFAMCQNGERPRQWTLNVLLHGLNVLHRSNMTRGTNLKPYWWTLTVTYMLKHNWTIERAFDYVQGRVDVPTDTWADWEDWRLVLEGEEHPPHFPTREDWVNEFGVTVATKLKEGIRK